MKLPILLVTLTLPFLTVAKEPALKSIFNGKDFAGWTMSEEGKFLIEDGVIKATNDGGKGDNLLTEKADYKTSSSNSNLNSAKATSTPVSFFATLESRFR